MQPICALKYPINWNRVRNHSRLRKRHESIRRLWLPINNYEPISYRFRDSLVLSCLVLQNNQQSSSWSITLMVMVGHGMRTGAHLASWALKAAGFSCSTTTAGRWFQSLTVLTARVVQPSRRCPYCPEFVSMVCFGPVVRSHQTNLIWIKTSKSAKLSHPVCLMPPLKGFPL